MDDATAEQQLRDYVGGLQQVIDQDRAALETLRRKSFVIEKRIARTTKAIRALREGSETPKKKKAKSVERDPSTYVGQDSIDRVLETFQQAREPVLTQGDIMERTGLSHAPVGAAIRILRDREVLRRAGSQGGTRKHLYALMPDWKEDSAVTVTMSDEATND